MAYETANPIKLTAGGPGGSIRIWSYSDGDAAATIDGSGYFDLEANRLKVGDVINAVANGVVATFKVLSNSGGVVDVSNAPANVDSD